MKKNLFNVAAAFALLMTLLTMNQPLMALTSVFINEIHYDNTGTDVGEAIEVAGPAGTDLTGWSLELYNGSNGLSYNTIALSGVIPNQQNGFGTVAIFLPTNGLQNGSPDGMALVDNGSVVQFLSYEGSFVAGDGPANGMTSTDIGVSEAFNSAVGHSLQLEGTGTTYEDFSWAGSQPNTFGAVNTNQSFGGGPATPPIVINEIMQNPSAVSDGSGEWFELYNAGSSDVDINGWTIADDDFDSHVIANGGPLVIPSGGYLVLGNNANSSTNGGVTVDYSYNGGWFLSNSADEVILRDGDGNEVDRVNYDGGPVFPDPNGASMSLSDPDLDNNVGANWCTSVTPFGNGDLGTPGAANECGSGAIEAKIHEVQGSGDSVAITTLVTVEAIVVGDFQESDQLDGFFIQEEDGDVDGDPNTSEGIFVYCDSCPVDVAVGDLVEVTGLPEEFFGMSQIDVSGSDGAVDVMSSGNTLPTPASLNLPASGDTEAEVTFESVEGMLVTFSDTLVVSEYFQLARFGQLVLTANDRPQQFTDANEPSVAGYAAFLDDLNSKRIILDDDNNIQNDAIFVGPDEPYYWPRPGLSITNFIRGGDSIDDLTGVMHWSWAGSGGTDAWRIRPVLEAFTYDFDSNNPRPAAPDPVGGTLKVASFNVLNYFTTLDERGADSPAELDRQREKIAAAVCAMDADIVGLIEIENNGTAVVDLLNGTGGINATCGTYDYIDTGVIGTDAIAVAFIYRTSTVTPEGDFAVLDDASFVDPLNTGEPRNRPALAQTFADSDGGTLTVVVNHLKSKGGSEIDDNGAVCNDGNPGNDIPDCDQNDGQAYFNATRTAAAEALVDWLATDPTDSNDPDILIIGDLNAYRNEDPIDAIEEGADDTLGTSDDYTDLLDALIGEEAYSFVFDGQIGYLDYAMANQDLLSQVTGVTVWHINADEIPVFDYNDDIDDGSAEASFERESSALPIYEPNAYRASDHDPVIVGLDLNASPDCSGAYPSQSSLWPPNHKFQTIDVLGVTDPEGDAFTLTIDGIFQDEAVDAPDSGNTAPDGQIVDGDTVEVRAERVGDGGNGRVYHIFFTATDSAGGSCSGEVLVSVPVSKNGVAVDDGPLFDSTVAP